MPLNLPDKLPAIELLKEENIFVIDNSHATGHPPVAHRYPELDAFEDYHGDRSCAFALQYTASGGNLVHENQESYIQEYACRTYADVLY